jgi:hypothetical protein
MGQYHVLVNLDKEEVVSPHGLGLGLKQYEHLGEFNGTLADAMYILTMTSPNRGNGDLPDTGISGRWAGDRVVVVGDYTSDADLPNYPNASLLFNATDKWVDITDLVATAFESVFRIKITGEGWKTRATV